MIWSNDDFYNLPRLEQETVLYVAYNARKSSKIQSEFISDKRFALASKLVFADGKIAWAIINSDTGLCLFKGIFPA